MRLIHLDAAEFYSVLAHLADAAIREANGATERKDEDSASQWLVLCELIEAAESHAGDMVGVHGAALQ